MKHIKHNNQYIIPSIYINIGRDGEFGTTMLMLAEIYTHKSDIKERGEDYNSDIIFTVKENFDDTLLQTFTGKKNTAVVPMSDLLKGSVYVAIKPLPSPTIWDLSTQEQIQELRVVKEALLSSFLGESSLASDLVQLSILLQSPYSKVDGEKVYFKKISGNLAIKASQVSK